MEKLVRAEDTSNVDDTAVSSNELKEREKKRRRLKARKHFSSSSDEDLSFFEDKENNINRQNEILPALPQIEHFVSNKKQLLGTPIQNTSNILRENSFFNAVSSNSKY